MLNLNEVRLIGNLGETPELRRTTSSTPVTNLVLATSERYITSTGEKKERTTWHRIAVFGRDAESCCRYLHKGDQVMVRGRIENRSRELEGKQFYYPEIVADRVDFGSKKHNYEEATQEEE